MKQAVQAHPHIARAPLLQALGASRASFYRQERQAHAPPAAPGGTPEPTPCRAAGRALSQPERQRVLGLLYDQEFADLAPPQVYAKLLDGGNYYCSARTMYRLLKQDGPCPERTPARSRPVYEKPELLATGPNQLWSWDITKLKGPERYCYYCLYVILDVFSRYVVAWMVAEREDQELAAQLIDQALAAQNVIPGTLTIHADRGAAMTSKTVALLLCDLGVAKTHSRPHVSNDNPYSEAQFKTLKYRSAAEIPIHRDRPEFPRRFGSIEDARATCQRLFQWYTGEHHHAGIALLTPAAVHYGRAEEVLRKRQTALDAAYKAHPERFVNRPPSPPALPQAVWINKPTPATSLQEAATGAAASGNNHNNKRTVPNTSRPRAPSAEACTTADTYNKVSHLY